MGFANSWAELIIRCTTIISYSIIFNGKAGEVFRTTSGVR